LNNFEHFLNLVLEKCPALERIDLETSFDDRKDKAASRKFVMETLAQLTTKLKNLDNRGPVNFVVSYNQALYDRTLRYNNIKH
jgi:hypothetical protein